MNAAARFVQHSSLSQQLVYFHLLSKRQLIVSLLILGVVFSGLGIIYFTHFQRLLYANYQQLLLEKNRLQIEQSQLLLERSTWMVQSRIQTIAETQLDMIIPEAKSIIIVHE